MSNYRTKRIITDVLHYVIVTCVIAVFASCMVAVWTGEPEDIELFVKGIVTLALIGGLAAFISIMID